MRPFRTLATLFIVILVTSCFIVPPPKGPQEGEPAPEGEVQPEEPQPGEPEPEPEGEPSLADEVPVREPADEEEPPPPPPTPPKEVEQLVKELGAGDWVHLGHKVPAFTVEKGKVRVTKKKGGFSKLAFIVADAGLELTDTVVVFGNGDRWDPKVRSVFKAGSRTRKIDLPNKSRYIKRLVFKYKSTGADGQKANLHVYGKAAPKGKAAVEPKPEDPKPEEPQPEEPTPMADIVDLEKIKAELGDGDWKVLGSREVVAGELHSVIAVGKDAGELKYIALATSGVEMDLLSWVIHFEDGGTKSPKVQPTFKAGHLTRRFGLDKATRVIKEIHFTIESKDAEKVGAIHLFGRP